MTIILDQTMNLDVTHDYEWYAARVVEEYDAHRKEGREFKPTPDVIWHEEDGAWEIPPSAEDGHWVRLTGPNAERLNGKRVRVIVITDPPEDKALLFDRLNFMDHFIGKWKRSRARDEGDFMAGRRAGWIDAMAFVLGKRWGEVRDALERNEV